MRDKERLELLENGSAFSSDDITFLLKQARLYQISRDETRRNCYEIRKQNNKLEQQNKRYREALEFYASKETYEHVLRSEAVYENGICISPLDLEPPVIYFDKGEIARKELEGESE